MYIRSPLQFTLSPDPTRPSSSREGGGGERSCAIRLSLAVRVSTSRPAPMQNVRI
ncbi:hypothetical protein VTK73DRAFT_5951 [Phialemonium thermophilum]|uniref:Uncharacterized protein n=1 Tax=Phialemonium thermophilum TaxID=223376 RepID=A0ABR3V0D1_9PEZI